MVALFGKKLESWEILRRRMLRETEAFLEKGLYESDHQVQIPAVRVGEANFTRGFADLFWARILESS